MVENNLGIDNCFSTLSWKRLDKYIAVNGHVIIAEFSTSITAAFRNNHCRFLEEELEQRIKGLVYANNFKGYIVIAEVRLNVDCFSNRRFIWKQLLADFG